VKNAFIFLHRKKKGYNKNLFPNPFSMATLSPRKKRFLIALPLGVVAGLICTWLASSSAPDIWGTALMWTIILNRWTIGLVVAFAGVYMRHPVFDFRIPPYFRGFML
jgi:hypothetical protein